mmetsp:Transcript_55300/g.91572  ORF Transcript_55300/g.91572 Transcript_55300/m.91572 type:complete len:315 (+) Transcript_55300:1001-1945(+)
MIQSLYNLLCFDLRVRWFGVCERVVPLEAYATLDPLGPLLGNDERQKHLKRLPAVSSNSNSRVNDPPELRRLDVEVHQTAPPLLVRQLGFRSVPVEHSGGSVIEARPDCDDQIGLLNRIVGIRSAMHAKHVKGERVILVKDTHRMECGRNRHVTLLSEGEQLVSSRHRPLPHVQNRLLCNRQKPSHRRQVARVRRDLGRFERQRDSRTAQYRSHDVLGQIDVHGTRLAGCCDVERFVYDRTHLLDRLNLVAPFGARPRQIHSQAFLEGICSDCRSRYLARKRHHRRGVASRILQWRYDVCQSRARRCQHHAYPP